MLDPVRPAAAAGTFYPADPDALGRLVDVLLREARPVEPGPLPKALIVPHAGFVYSGPVAATAFARLAPHADRIARVVLVGPAHRVRIDGLASPGASALRTPLGDVPVDAAALALVPEVPASPTAERGPS